MMGFKVKAGKITSQNNTRNLIGSKMRMSSLESRMKILKVYYSTLNIVILYENFAKARLINDPFYFIIIEVKVLFLEFYFTSLI